MTFGFGPLAARILGVRDRIPSVLADLSKIFQVSSHRCIEPSPTNAELLELL